MSDFHGITFAYGAVPELGELTKARTASSLPFCGRYRLIDFALSSFMNAGIHDVGVIMRRDYQSLLDHLASGKDWDMGRRIGGLRMLPPFGLPEYHQGDYTGTIEALNAVSTYISEINAKYIVMMHGNTAANIDMSAAIEQHLRTGAEITAICTETTPDYTHHRYMPEQDGFARSMMFRQTAAGPGLASLDAYIISKELLLSMMETCRAENRYHFHRDAIAQYLANGGKVGVYVHRGYGRRIMSTQSFFSANMDMLSSEKRAELFPPERPVRTKTHEDVSTYYAEGSRASNSLVADGCIIEGEIDNCIISSDVRIAKGAKLDGCVVMRGAKIGEGVVMKNVVVDKASELSPYQTLMGSEKLPVVLPKGTKI